MALPLSTSAARAILRRILVLASSFALLSLGLFYLLTVVPGSRESARIAEDPTLSPAERDRIRTISGLDRPFLDRYGCWLFGHDEGPCSYAGGRGVLRGDLGWSVLHRTRVSQILPLRLSRSVVLLLPALLIGLLLSIGLGLAAALAQGRPIDRLISWLSFFGLALPSHVAGLFAILIFAVSLTWLPAGGVSRSGGNPDLLHLVLPVAVLALHFVARWSRFVRSELIEVLGLDHVIAARARGLSEVQVVLRHGLRNALFPLITVVAQSLPALFSGALIVERVFNFPGMGLLIFEAVSGGDGVLALAACLGYAAVTFLATGMAEIGYALADPRVRQGAAL